MGNKSDTSGLYTVDGLGNVLPTHRNPDMAIYDHGLLPLARHLIIEPKEAKKRICRTIQMIF
jgi:hypothetical protein